MDFLAEHGIRCGDRDTAAAEDCSRQSGTRAVRSCDTSEHNLQKVTVEFPLGCLVAVTGVSDSANAVLFYDKNGVQARVAYNWRDGFLSGYGFDPYYVEAYGQFDVSASWEFRKGFTVYVEGINVTEEDRRGHMRNGNTVFFAAPGYARYAVGIRTNF